MTKIKDTLFIIPARGGSKGLPKKNSFKINHKPLILYTVDAARRISSDENICVSTDDKEIIEIVEKHGLKVPFIRPDDLATDNSSTWDVVHHAVEFYKKLGKSYKMICILQPTSPLRDSKDIVKAHKLWSDELDMVVSVKNSKRASVICNEDKDGFLELTLNKTGKRRQEIKNYFEYNGAIYFVNVKSLRVGENPSFQKIRKYVMDDARSIDIDNILDVKMAEFIINQQTK